MENVSAGAISKARSKLSPKAFILLNDTLVKEFYTDNLVNTFYGFNILAIDGSTLQLPFSSDIIKKYGYASNQTNKEIPTARISYL